MAGAFYLRWRWELRWGDGAGTFCFLLEICNWRWCCCFMMKIKLICFLCAVVALGLCGCRVETNSEPVPEAEGSGKKAINIRVEPMSRDEIKSAADRAIDETAEAAGKLRNAATTAAQNLESVGRTVTTLSNTLRKNDGADDDAPVEATPAATPADGK